MGKDKVVEDISKNINKVINGGTNNVILQYAPLILGLICLVVCYLLFKKIQTLSSHGDSIYKLEKQFTQFIKEQSEVNTISAKKFNAMISQINQLSYLVQNNNLREFNTVDSQMSPERPTGPQGPQGPRGPRGPQGPQGPETQGFDREKPEQPVQPELPVQPEQRELMPTSVIQTNFPVKQNTEPFVESMIPQMTTNKKEKLNTANGLNKQSNKKIIAVDESKEEVLIEEASSDDE